MKKIRIANAHYLSALPFRSLGENDLVEYEERSPAENARRLHEGQVDVAMIPLADYALHGGYLALDYCIGSFHRAHSLMLYANDKINRLKVIYLCDGSSSSYLLLRLLLRDKWMCMPRLVQLSRESLPAKLAPDEGVFMRQRSSGSVNSFAVAEDLVHLWYELTGKPFIYLVWALRVDRFSTIHDLRTVHELFDGCVQSRQARANQRADEFQLPEGVSSRFVLESRIYDVDDDVREGISHFLNRASSHHFIPLTPFKTVSQVLSERKRRRAPSARGVSEILSSAFHGQRIGVSDAMKLIQDGELADLGMLADALRARRYPRRNWKTSGVLPEDRWRDVFRSRDVSQFDGLSLQVRRPLSRLTVYQQVIQEVNAQVRLPCEAFTVSDLVTLSKKNNVALAQVLSRLAQSGVDQIDATDGDFLVDAVMHRRGNVGWGSVQWLQVLSWAHASGLQSRCAIRLGTDESWEERVVHLYRLRNLQDETPGIISFSVIPHRERGARSPTPPQLEESLRARAVARIFLDSIPCVEERSSEESLFGALAGLSFGSNQVVSCSQILSSNESVSSERDRFSGLWDLAGEIIPTELV